MFRSFNHMVLTKWVGPLDDTFGKEKYKCRQLRHIVNKVRTTVEKNPNTEIWVKKFVKWSEEELLEEVPADEEVKEVDRKKWTVMQLVTRNKPSLYPTLLKSKVMEVSGLQPIWELLTEMQQKTQIKILQELMMTAVPLITVLPVQDKVSELVKKMKQQNVKKEDIPGKMMENIMDSSVLDPYLANNNAELKQAMERMMRMSYTGDPEKDKALDEMKKNMMQDMDGTAAENPMDDIKKQMDQFKDKNGKFNMKKMMKMMKEDMKKNGVDRAEFERMTSMMMPGNIKNHPAFGKLMSDFMPS
jgi:hypothetical protein